MARAMDQDVLPILLVLRTVRPPPEYGQLFYAWPGVERHARDGKVPVEIDLVISIAQAVWCFEAEQNAASLKAPQLRRQMKPSASRLQRRALGRRPPALQLQGIDSSEIISTVHGRPSPTISANGGLQARRSHQVSAGPCLPTGPAKHLRLATGGHLIG